MADPIRFEMDIDKLIDTIADFVESASKAVTKRERKRIGDLAVRQMKIQSAKGISSVKGFGRFPAYKNPSRYPAFRKPERPVNLTLTGQQLDSLKSRTKGADKIQVFYGNKLAADKEKGHREGVGGQPIRPVLPLDSEKLSRVITKKLEDEYVEIIEKHLNALLESE